MLEARVGDLRVGENQACECGQRLQVLEARVGDLRVDENQACECGQVGAPKISAVCKIQLLPYGVRDDSPLRDRLRQLLVLLLRQEARNFLSRWMLGQPGSPRIGLEKFGKELLLL